ncbi:hypothetical protein [Gymnodinialimonas ceratoperidinii]|uniref:Uncharacterized protein n=1 Tax=Gymnodinialimonas ceratoperidinii TaxID=2856823 RepID=A0A8F6YE55_9RHOB|nr:hypothetical protein [Gymnodinialimonas ceratoperidinii]QXT41230.1 hypothetical protein KYE46_08480 [Gymnodinialimonas ceratoperidinii]
MSETVVGTLVVLGTLYLVCGLFLLWAWFSVDYRLARLLRWGAITPALWLTLCFAVMLFLGESCTGNWLYGFIDCPWIDPDTADWLISLGFLNFAFATLYALGLFLVALVSEIILRRRRRR